MFGQKYFAPLLTIRSYYPNTKEAFISMRFEDKCEHQLIGIRRCIQKEYGEQRRKTAQFMRTTMNQNEKLVMMTRCRPSLSLIFCSNKVKFISFENKKLLIKAKFSIF